MPDPATDSRPAGGPASRMRRQLRDLREGFRPAFWVANGMELFERLAYYGQGTILAIFLRNHLHFSEIDAGKISSVFGFLIYCLPIFAGTLADKYGFRKAFSFAFAVLAVGYFLIGSTGMAGFQSLYEGIPLPLLLIPMVVLTAVGGSFIKPAVLGTVAVTSSPRTKSLGFAIYYSIVNAGAAIGPVIAYLVRDRFGIEFVYVVSAVSCALMFVVNFFWFRDVAAAGEASASLREKLLNLVRVIRNARFIIFLLIFSLYWIMFWQILVVIPFYITDFISPDAPFEIVSSVDAWSIIALQLVVNRFTRHLPTRTAILAGFAVSSLCWIVISIHPSIAMIVAGIFVWSIGEMTQAPRYYEYVSDLAPKGQQALFQGYAFLPVAIGWLVGGTLGGWLYATYAKGAENPAMLWYVLFGIGVLATGLMWLYNTLVSPKPSEEGT